MASGRYGAAMAQMGRLFGPMGTASGQGEGSLLERFARDRDGAAFEALVARHGPMVLGVCRRALDRPDDAEDAFQATFLVLARRAGSIRDGDRLGPWLHGVARRVAARARARSAIHRSRERPTLIEPSTSEAISPLESAELRATLDEELGRLPEKYRVPLILCYLEGLTHDEAASRLGWPVGTVRSRLAGGRDRLRPRLARLGLSPSAGLAAVLPSASISEALISTTARLATAAGSPIPASVSTLAKGAFVAMKWGSLKAVSPALALAAGLVVGGAGLVVLRSASGNAEGQPTSDPLRRELDETRARVQALERELANHGARGSAPAESGSAPSPAPGGMMGPGMMASMPGMMPGGAAGMMAGGAIPSLPIVQQISNGSDIPWLLVISDTRDRATMIDPRSQRKATLRLPEDAKLEVVPIAGPNSVTLQMKTTGPAITRAAVFDPERFRWTEHELKEPVTELNLSAGGPLVGLSAKAPEITRVSVYLAQDDLWADQDLVEPAEGSIAPIVGANTIRYHVGRRLYVFSAPAKRWSVLELKNDAFAAMARGGLSLMQGVPVTGGVLGMNGGKGDGSMIVPDEDAIHIYDPKTGDWTHISTKDDQ